MTSSNRSMAAVLICMFLFGAVTCPGPAQAVVARLIAINKTDASVKICFLFIFVSPLGLEMLAY